MITVVIRMKRILLLLILTAAVFAVIEQLKKSNWLMLEDREPSVALLFVEGHLLYDDLMDLGKTFSRETGCPKVFIAKTGERKYGLKVTAVIGF